VFSLSLDKVKEIMKRRADLSKAYSEVEKQVLFMKHEIALDYLFPNEMWEDYEGQLERNHLRVRLKNAIMQTWNQLKAEARPPDVGELIENLVAKKAADKKKGKDN
jgi:hypothetical protein